MIGEFLSKITLLYTAIIAIICVILFIVVAHKKPNWYTSTSRIMILLIGLILFFRLGWQSAITHHHIPYNKQLRIPSNLSGVFYLLLLLDVFWLRSVAKKRVEESKGNTEEKATIDL